MADVATTRVLSSRLKSQFYIFAQTCTHAASHPRILPLWPIWCDCSNNSMHPSCSDICNHIKACFALLSSGCMRVLPKLMTCDRLQVSLSAMTKCCRAGCSHTKILSGTGLALITTCCPSMPPSVLSISTMRMVRRTGCTEITRYGICPNDGV